MAKHHLPDRHERDATIENLRRELAASRIAFIEMMPDEVRKILWTFLRCESRHDAYAWPKKIAQELVTLAEPIASPFGERAICPLCRSEGGSPYETGYSLPIGLLRHLIGFGNVRECPVMAAARSVAQEHWNEKFSPTERAAEVEKDAVLLRRLASETLFSDGPNTKPALFDSVSSLSGPRTKSEMASALSRLKELQFRRVNEGNVESYVDDRGEHIIYADPRENGNIDFKAYRRLPLPKSGGTKVRYKLVGNFRLPDRWKHDLYKKYQKWLAATIRAADK